MSSTRRARKVASLCRLSGFKIGYPTLPYATLSYIDISIVRQVFRTMKFIERVLVTPEVYWSAN